MYVYLIFREGGVIMIDYRGGTWGFRTLAAGPHWGWDASLAPRAMIMASPSLHFDGHNQV